MAGSAGLDTLAAPAAGETLSQLPPEAVDTPALQEKLAPPAGKSVAVFGGGFVPPTTAVNVTAAGSNSSRGASFCANTFSATCTLCSSCAAPGVLTWIRAE